jgi:2'-5' RNA ligase
VSQAQFRVFFALWPEPDLRGALATWGRAMQRELGGRLTRAETIHLTLAFIGEVDAEGLDALRAIGGRLNGAAFDLPIDRVGCWPHNGVAWAGSAATPSAVSALVGDLRDELGREGFRVENRNFETHITLLRKARCAPLRWQPPEPLAWPVRRFVLVRSVLSSEGSTYSELASWPLQD